MEYSSALSNLQSRQQIDISQTYQSWRHLSEHYRASYAGGMGWKSIGGKDYLYRVTNRTGGGRSLGPRALATEDIYEKFHSGKLKTKARLKDLSASLAILAGGARAGKIARVPRLTANILRKLDEQNVLGRNLIVIGTNAAYAYEAAAGCLLDTGLTATTDCDLMWDARSTLRLAGPEMRNGGLLAVLQSVDKSFQTYNASAFCAVNSSGFMIDLVKATPIPPWKNERSKLSEQDAMTASEIVNLKSMLASPKFVATAIGEDGFPVPMVAPDPRAFAIYKLFLSSQSDRDPTKKDRDRRQAFAVTELIEKRLTHLPFDNKSQLIFPVEMRGLVDELRQPFIDGNGRDDLPDAFKIAP
ncbi:GSU2403 family nucleotidyltransferase fold protein [Actimicrobium sp. CCI2.3]|uniref:GSU2403 family nucleotidyltransferase fold protein n=1 Tax=Actimicrobium sp. CCI2.3 TaxID=3048616 RepID=UPI002AB5652A|nr:GSU2403 family nucleotidyltransferase fold protein [Actimicrobium sp. CCI2.3]MDY7574632.1 GSU2403 family nucleotidyltransferase fold protein [Actimicrobium sp. CCI2.3]MEB0023975.1 GSU2403 family nucleotidyltransferase fold protein [Actimicrobium sp. CCI2.3]